MKNLSFIFKLSLFVCLLVFTQCTTEQREELSPIPEPSLQLDNISASSRNNAKIPGQYIIVLKEDAATKGNKDAIRGKANGLAAKHGFAKGNIEHIYSSALQGFSVTLSNGQLKKLEKDGLIASIEADKVIALAPPPGKGPGNDGGGTDPAQDNDLYGILRVNGGDDGIGKIAWVIDSGIDTDHPDLNVDASRGFSAFTKGKDAGTNDGNGHGTHVAGTIAAVNNDIGVIGVAAGATVIPVKVLGARGSGSTSGVIAGIDHVAANGQSGEVANMSLGGGVSATLDQAVIDASASSGVIFALAAGNESDDANNHSPARAGGFSATDNVFSISAMDVNDNFASFSNFGSAVAYCAPGVAIKSTWKDGGYNTISGTSMACPHAAGVLLMRGTPASTNGTVNADPDGNADAIITL